jgi:Ca-activated chloride channel homolog
MHLRSKLFPLVTFLCLLGVAAAQSTAPGSSFPTVGSQQPAPQYPAQPQPPAPAQPQSQYPPAQQQAQPPASQQQPQAQQPTSQQGQSAGESPAAPQDAQPPARPGQDTIQVPGSPQEPSTSSNGTFIFRKNVDEVVLHATVVDDKGRLVTNLPRGAFQVFENGVAKPITSFHQEDIPVALGIIIDNSGSMRDKRQAVNTASLDLVKSSNPKDQVFIVNFNDEYYLDQDFTSDVNKLKEGLEQIDSRGGTALYDAVIASADHLKRNGKLDKKVILVVTDGEDNSSRDTLEQAVRRVSEEGGPTIYSIGILGDEHTKRAKRALTSLSEQTGGIAFFPKDVSEVDQIAQTVARDIRNQYTITFKKDPNAQPGYRTIKVVARAPGYKNLSVRTLSGYYSQQQRASR